MKAALLWCAGCACAAPEGVSVAAAASTAEALEALLPKGVRLDSGASSTLARRIEAGAPVDLFLSADTHWMDHLQLKGFLAEGTRCDFLGAALVVIGPADAAPGPWEAVLDHAERVATGDPDHVPVGRYAKSSIGAGWDRLVPKLVRTADVRAAQALVEHGEVDAAIVYRPGALVPGKTAILAQLPDPSPPVRYSLAILRGRARPAVQAVYQQLLGPKAQAAFETAGFEFRSCP